MRICFMLGGFHQNGGIGRVTSLLANELAEQNKMEILTLSYVNWKSPNIYEVSSKVMQRYLLPEYISMTKLMLKGGVKKLKSFLTENKVDIIIACGALFYPICVEACKKIDTKCICWEHSNPEGNSDHKAQSISRRYGIKKADLNVVLTKSAKEIYEKKYNISNVVQIYNPIDEKALKYSKEYKCDSKKIISVGRLSYQKYFEKAIEVASKVLPLVPDWEWDIFGKGEELEGLQKLIQNYGLDCQVHLCGQVSDLYKRYNDYSFMVMTSRYEGFPMSLLEGSANSLPLISFDIPTGPNEIIVDNENGYLIKAFDTEKMAEKVRWLIEHEEVRIEMSKNSKQMSYKFSEGEIVNQWMHILKKLTLN